MKKIWIVFSTEFINIITRKSFILTLLLVPLGALVVGFIISTTSRSSAAQTGEQNFFTELISPQQAERVEGFVDSAGLLRLNRPDIQQTLIPFETIEMASQAMNEGSIDGYYLLPQDFLTYGTVYYIRPDFNPLSGMDQSSAFLDLISYNLANGDLDLANRLSDPINVESVYLSPQPVRDPESIFTFLIPYGVTMLFYMVILTSSSLMLSSINTEKNNRVLEILMTSLTPTQILTGKILALGLVGLLQTLFWGGLGFASLNNYLSTSNLGNAFQLPPTIIFWGVIFFLLGYLIYSSLMGGIGALVSNLREASQVTTVVILPLIVPLILISALIGEPNGTLATILSIFPLTSPVAMMTRLSATIVPTWQLVLAAFLAALTGWIIIRAVAGLFRAQNLLSGQAFSLRLFIRALTGKA